MLVDNDVDTIVDALVAQGNNTPQVLRNFVQLFADVTFVPPQTTVSADARGIIMHLDKNQPRGLLRVLRYFGASNLDIAHLAETYESDVKRKEVLSSREPWRDRLLASGVVMLDRRPLRDLIELLVNNATPRAVLVKGPKKCGKTFTFELIRHVASRLGDNFANVRSSTSQGVSGTVGSILSQLDDPQPNVDAILSPDSHWYNFQCNRIVTAARRGGGRAWIVIDNMSEGPTLELCQYLIEAVVTSNSKARLVLLGYPPDIAPDTVLPHEVDWDRLVHGAVAESDVRDFLQWFFRDVRQTPLAEPTLAAEVQAIVGAQKPNDETFLNTAGPAMFERVRRAELKG